MASCSNDQFHFLPGPLAETSFVSPKCSAYTKLVLTSGPVPVMLLSPPEMPARYRALCYLVFDCFALTSCVSILKGERALVSDLGLNRGLAVCYVTSGRSLKVSDP